MTGFPPPKITWSKEPGRIPVVKSIQEEQLKIYNSRKQDSGLYKCQASNLLGTDSASTFVTVVALPKFTVKPPEVLNVSKEDDVSVICRSIAEFRPTITWSKINGEVPRGRSQVLADGTLKITGVVRGDAGRYVCTASAVGVKSHAEMQLNVESKCSVA